MVETALDNGYRHFDTAQVYNTERAVGEALRRKSNLINRKEVFVTTKVCPHTCTYMNTFANPLSMRNGHNFQSLLTTSGKTMFAAGLN